jgi:predicted SnoaL-like aldol condensation-catalyzing enzyme
MSKLSRKDLIRKLLKGIETGDPAAAAVVNEERYIQHNPQTAEGGEGLAALFARISKSNPTVNVVRAFEDGDYVFGHTEYNFATRRIGFELFKFEGTQAVEHWDNIQPRGNDDMITGPTEATDLHLTEDNRARVRDFIEQVMITGQWEDMGAYVAADLIQHAPYIQESGLKASQSFLSQGKHKYETLHRVMAEGDFCLAVSEGYRDGVHTSFYDLYRVADQKLVEHWDTVEAVPPKSGWKNNNGKF